MSNDNTNDIPCLSQPLHSVGSTPPTSAQPFSLPGEEFSNVITDVTIVKIIDFTSPGPVFSSRSNFEKLVLSTIALSLKKTALNYPVAASLPHILGSYLRYCPI